MCSLGLCSCVVGTVRLIRRCRKCTAVARRVLTRGRWSLSPGPPTLGLRLPREGVACSTWGVWLRLIDRCPRAAALAEPRCFQVTAPGSSCPVLRTFQFAFGCSSRRRIRLPGPKTCPPWTRQEGEFLASLTLPLRPTVMPSSAPDVWNAPVAWESRRQCRAPRSHACPHARCRTRASRRLASPSAAGVPRSPEVSRRSCRSFPTAVPPERGPFAAGGRQGPSPYPGCLSWLHRVESVDGTPWLSRCQSPLSVPWSPCSQDPPSTAVGASVLPDARAIPVSGSFSQGR